MEINSIQRVPSIKKIENKTQDPRPQPQETNYHEAKQKSHAPTEKIEIGYDPESGTLYTKHVDPHTKEVLASYPNPDSLATKAINKNESDPILDTSPDTYKINRTI